MAKLFDAKGSKESMNWDVGSGDCPYAEERHSNIVADCICDVVFLDALFFWEESQEGAESLESVDEGCVGEEEENDEGGVIEVETELAFEYVVVEGEWDEEVGVLMGREVLITEKKATTSAKMALLFEVAGGYSFFLSLLISLGGMIETE